MFCTLLVISSAGLAFHNLVKCCMCMRVVCLDVDQRGMNRNRCTQRLVIFHAHTC